MSAECVPRQCCSLYGTHLCACACVRGYRSLYSAHFSSAGRLYPSSRSSTASASSPPLPASESVSPSDPPTAAASSRGGASRSKCDRGESGESELGVDARELENEPAADGGLAAAPAVNLWSIGFRRHSVGAALADQCVACGAA